MLPDWNVPEVAVQALATTLVGLTTLVITHRLPAIRQVDQRNRIGAFG
ncbi:MAG TPA: hypothetical protein VHY58_12205 [Streptosporangiaceae bacterium]|jgi:ABC-type multidrug transport system fused ATPase/permease subunit|nr:hypothetical protein [Streptosporangiaceae bacterium]